MPDEPLRILTRGFPGRAVHDTAVSHALLRAVARGEVGESLRLYRPDPIVVFSLLDRRSEGFERALAHARALGFDAVLRLGGGHAAVFHEQSVAFAWAQPVSGGPAGIRERFDAVSSLLARALRRLGADARVGSVPGEYCCGDHSLNLGGRIKVMGVGQRVIRGAAHLGGVIVVDRSDRLREVLAPVYEALGLEWRPETAGALSDVLGPIEHEDVVAAIEDELREERPIAHAEIEEAVVSDAETLRDWHDPESHPRRGAAGGSEPGGRGKTIEVEE